METDGMKTAQRSLRCGRFFLWPSKGPNRPKTSSTRTGQPPHRWMWIYLYTPFRQQCKHTARTDTTGIRRKSKLCRANKINKWIGGCVAQLFLQEQSFSLRKAMRTFGQKLRLYLLRFILNLIVLCLLGGAFYLIYFSTHVSQQKTVKFDLFNG